MNYFIERGRNIENADEMNEALQCANALCGFNSCVIEILEKKKYKKQKHISNIQNTCNKIHISWKQCQLQNMAVLWCWFRKGCNLRDRA